MQYDWMEINEALMETGHSPKQILRVLSAMNDQRKFAVQVPAGMCFEDDEHMPGRRYSIEASELDLPVGQFPQCVMLMHSMEEPTNFEMLVQRGEVTEVGAVYKNDDGVTLTIFND